MSTLECMVFGNVTRARLLMRLGEIAACVAYFGLLAFAGTTFPRERFWVTAGMGLAVIMLVLFIGWKVDDADEQR